VSTWKVILATLVIFVAGVITGGVLVNLNKRSEPKVYPPPNEPILGPRLLQRDFIFRLQRELNLSPDQRDRIERIVRDSRERTAELWRLLEPEMREELGHVRDRIREELTPSQRHRFEELVRQRPQRLGPNPARGSQPFRPPAQGSGPVSPEGPREPSPGGPQPQRAEPLPGSRDGAGPAQSFPNRPSPNRPPPPETP
jgi:hypothetical protein